MGAAIAEYGPSLLAGFWTTVWLSAAVIALSLVGGTALLLLRDSGVRALALPAAVVVNVLRVLPALLVLFFVFYASPQLGVRFAPTTAALIGLSAIGAAYMSEDLRGAFAAVDAGQWRAGKALGLSYARTLRRIVAPQALPLAIPPVASRAIIIMKGTSLASFVAVSDLTGAAARATSITYEPFVFLVVAGVGYLALSGLIVLAQAWGERRFAVGGRSGLAR